MGFLLFWTIISSFLWNSCRNFQNLLKDVSREMLNIIFFFYWIIYCTFFFEFSSAEYLNGQAWKLVIIAQLSQIYTYVEIWGYLTCYKVPLSFWFNYFFDSRAEIHEIFSLFFWKFKKSKSHAEINWPLNK